MLQVTHLRNALPNDVWESSALHSFNGETEKARGRKRLWRLL